MKFLLIFLLIFSISSCTNYYNEMVKWADNIPKGTDISIVKKNQPKFIEVNWENPDVFENEKRYLITKIKWDNDILNMSNYLVFIDNQYQGRYPHK